jgi:hypothetical protein
VAVIDEHRGSSDAPFDVAVALTDECDRARRADMVEEYADAGVTWWMEGILDDVGPLEEVRTIIRNGPQAG